MDAMPELRLPLLLDDGRPRTISIQTSSAVIPQAQMVFFHGASSKSITADPVLPMGLGPYLSRCSHRPARSRPLSAAASTQIWIKIKAFYDYEIQMEASPPLLGRQSIPNFDKVHSAEMERKHSARFGNTRTLHAYG
ncbi:uncharacterized protein LOC124672803 [Lolium rigidum]|uniref:uncharacterized protein LOC124672803 n=1 Tax=Lolium rigidum TaxID=89674 RepID=UPI001F5CAD18|nr:uncharacterized protein LOC124672803 [Lolium rigidum]